MAIGDDAWWERLAEDPKRMAAEVCHIDVVNLDKTLRQHASKRAWFNAAHETARIEEAQAEFEVVKARARAVLRSKEGQAPGLKRGQGKSVEIIKAEAETDAEYITAMEIYLDARRRRAALKAISEALEDRLQMLMQISANQRKERHDSQVSG